MLNKNESTGAAAMPIFKQCAKIKAEISMLS
jgi:hypothetical protein